MIDQEIEEVVGRFLSEELIAEWWDTPTPAFYMRTPKQVLESGEREKVLAFVVLFSTPISDPGYS